MADLMRPEFVRSFPPADNPAEAAMTDSARPVCDCPEPCACYAEGYVPSLTALIKGQFRVDQIWRCTNAQKHVQGKMLPVRQGLWQR